MFRRKSGLLPILVCCAGFASAHADVKLSTIFGDHMVLQQGQKLPVWGTASPGEKVKVTFGTQTGSAVADVQGQWRIDLTPAPANSQPGVLTVTGNNTLNFRDVLVGEVWIASGQSNMEFGIQTDSRAAESIAKADDSQLRFFVVPASTALEPKAEIGAPRRDDLWSAKWQVCTPEMMGNPKWAWHGFSAVGYYFARELRQSTGKPVGMIATYKGGTPAEAWTSVAGLQKESALAHFIAEHQKYVDGFAAASEAFPKLNADFQAAMKQWNEEVGKEYNAQLAQWEQAAAQAKAAGENPPPKPQPSRPRPSSPAAPDGGFSAPGNLFNAMVAPLIPYGIRGVIWYQGESNGDNIAESVEYSTLYPRMITDWREHWNQGNFPFLCVYLANFGKPAATPSEGYWPWVREAQTKALALPNTGVASAIDIGDAADIHPKGKLDVGIRLARAAQHIAYGEKLVYSGPAYDSMKVEGRKIRISFKHTGKGLTLGVPPWTPSGKIPPVASELAGFAIAGADQKFVWAKASIEGNTVVASSDQVAQPVAVRYDWANNPPGNLYNKEGLPASPFRTDDWPAPVK